MCLPTSERVFSSTSSDAVFIESASCYGDYCIIIYKKTTFRSRLIRHYRAIHVVFRSSFKRQFNWQAVEVSEAYKYIQLF